jgi:limonene-1,2-epoxide hydrolase
MDANERLIRAFCAAWAQRDIPTLLAYFHPDAVYHNIPLPPLRGREEIRATLETFVAPAEEIEFEILHLAVNGNVVFTERVDRFSFAGKKVELPVAGVFEIEEGKIRAWRDYFDMQTWLRQTTGA